MIGTLHNKLSTWISARFLRSLLLLLQKKNIEYFFLDSRITDWTGTNKLKKVEGRLAKFVDDNLIE